MSSDNGYDDGEYLSLPELNDFADLKPKKARFRLGDKALILHEALAADIASWKNKQQAMIKYGPDNTVLSFGNQRDLDIQLVHLCTYYADNDGKLRYRKLDNGALIPDEKHRISLDVVRSWTFQLQDKVLETIKGMSGLNDEPLEVLEKKLEALEKLIEMKRGKAKNVLQPTESTSEEPTS